MTIDELVRQTLRDWSGEARVPGGLADRALGRRRRAGFRAFAVAAGAIVSAAAVAVALIAYKQNPQIVQVDGDRSATVLTGPGPARDVRADPESSPPEHLVAAYDLAVYAYSTWRHEMLSDDVRVLRRTWFLYDERSGGYERTRWAALDVAPGGRTAAVLEKLPARRVGVLGVGGGDVRWIDLDQPAGGVSWSPDGRRLLLTNYDGDPTVVGIIDSGGSERTPPNSRTGFTVVDVDSGRAAFREVAWAGMPRERGMDFRWSTDGTLVWERGHSAAEPKKFYDLVGKAQPVPERERHGSSQEAGLSPSGRWLADDYASLAITDTQGSRSTPLQRGVAGHLVERLVAWADDDHLIAWACELNGAAGCAGSEFRSRLVVIGRDGTSLVPLTGFQEHSQRPGAWEPLLSRR
ncbi:hypothetical protein [Planomonospora venezuelensis]|uniref:WD40-like Beta Propeller Repeat n=1 Tax=Planomonospora venezuelensis TaxID=1999 RepID=A0A841CXU1_PLAVE|nr:hypothetical protein [Planomonospora venezuelensis]MBB5960797.1 hypothetical protein [Planomonospora venezuelensis]GIN03809.1 hypothetical protein Pve01_54670 [Planomonospora venezuelensis]